MKVTPSPVGSRLDYVRAYINASIGYNAILVAPHGATVRASFTVPSGEKVRLASVGIVLNRAVAPASVGQVQALVEAKGSPVLTLDHYNVQLQTVVSQSVVIDTYLWPGDLVQIVTVDLSSGGNMTYSIVAELFRFPEA